MGCHLDIYNIRVFLVNDGLFYFGLTAEARKAATPENAMGLPSVVPSAETAASEVERQEREALADMFSPSSPRYDESIVAVPHTAVSGVVQTTPVTDGGAQCGEKDLHKTLDSSRGW